MLGWVKGQFWDGSRSELEEALFATALYLDGASADTDSDESYVLDKKFGVAFRVVAECAVSGDSVTQKVEDAADVMFEIATQAADQTMLSAAVSAGFSRFIEDGRAPPATVLEHIKDGFSRWALSAPSLDVAFGMSRDKRGNHSTWAARTRKRASVAVMQVLCETMSIPEAAAKIEQGLGARDMLRAYYKYKQTVKDSNSE